MNCFPLTEPSLLVATITTVSLTFTFILGQDAGYEDLARPSASWFPSMILDGRSGTATRTRGPG